MRFLIDSNLSAKLSAWTGTSFQYVADLEPGWSDEQVWQYAMEQDLVIVTKDADFYHWALLRDPAPPIVQFKIGNMRLKVWSSFVDSTWPTIIEALASGKIIQVYGDHIEVVRN